MTNKRWLARHRKDIYFKRAKEQGYPSRAAYKLLEIQKKDHLLKPGMSVVDLGSSPGGWSMVTRELVGEKGVVIAVDLLPIASIAGVDFIQGDFNELAVFERLQALVNEKTPTGQVDLVISDMAPNISGGKSVDQPKSVHLVELAWDCAKTLLKTGGTFLAKIFQGAGVDALVADLRRYFKHVKIRKPSASRQESREVYILGCEFLGYLGYNQDSGRP